MSGQIPVCSNLWKVPLECGLKSHRVQHVFEAWVRMRTCFSCHFYFTLCPFVDCKGRLSLYAEMSLCEHHLGPSREAGRKSVTRTVSWQRYGGGDEETSHWTFTVIPHRGSDGNSQFLLWTVCMLCLGPLSPVPHFVLSGTRENQRPAGINMGRCNKKYSLLR